MRWVRWLRGQLPGCLGLVGALLLACGAPADRPPERGQPGNPAVAVRTPDSPFSRYQRFGLKVDLGTVCEPPKAEVLQNLLAGWQRTHGT